MKQLRYLSLFLPFIGFSQEIEPKDSIEMEDSMELNEAVVTGTLKAVSKLDSPVAVEVYNSKFFAKNPTPSIFESIGMVNGVRPQINCSVCHTGDIHINGMEGPYTLVLIDGMPIVSALSTVYGLNGIPMSMVERVEIVKGPASSLFGSEAMGGIINVITQNPEKVPQFALDFMTSSWLEYSTDVATKWKWGKQHSLLGINYYQFDHLKDQNKDNFTDMSLQNRISVFNKWKFTRKENRLASLALRYVYEDRWGGELDYDKHIHRGSDQVYGESIYTSRGEIISMYQLPLREKIYAQFSYNFHKQDSWYGKIPFLATQQIGFAQIYWDKSWNSHQIVMGMSYRNNYYDDNTVATKTISGENHPEKTDLMGVFFQDEIQVNSLNKVLLGYRLDYDSNHGFVHSPRLVYKFNTVDKNHTIRGSFGTGFRVVNLFTEDHAALTGSREVIIKEELKPEKSYNFNLNYSGILASDSFILDFDLTGFYTFFTNQIIADYDVNPNQILYDNLKGHAISQGISLQTNLKFLGPLQISVGVSWMDVFRREKNELGEEFKEKQYFAPEWSGSFSFSYYFLNSWSIDFTGNWNGPMRLPIVPQDYRPDYSPWHLLANVQLKRRWDFGIEIYGGIKNIFNFVPKEDPILRAFDPFDLYVNDPIQNPYGYTFDTTYNYSSLQGRRAFIGIRYRLK